jgi:hypothetical protein
LQRGKNTKGELSAQPTGSGWSLTGTGKNSKWNLVSRVGDLFAFFVKPTMSQNTHRK